MKRVRPKTLYLLGSVTARRSVLSVGHTRSSVTTARRFRPSPTDGLSATDANMTDHSTSIIRLEGPKTLYLLGSVTARRSVRSVGHTRSSVTTARRFRPSPTGGLSATDAYITDQFHHHCD
ncbi:hypothetical protein JYU34_008193 [Plutella xylostella]|uniref:Secreted protein n=1 Tax=Plutella xylostella TaxID=51655 RepID=A0ABQ7QNZ2_PLUXY|nr:hypothetical protein JYU34_008193 [Plutella xylostella]